MVIIKEVDFPSYVKFEDVTEELNSVESVNTTGTEAIPFQLAEPRQAGSVHFGVIHVIDKSFVKSS
jgi:hypothetical protein